MQKLITINIFIFATLCIAAFFMIFQELRSLNSKIDGLRANQAKNEKAFVSHGHTSLALVDRGNNPMLRPEFLVIDED